MKFSSIYKTKTPEETIDLGQQLAKKLQSGMTVLLFGDLGSGKTHFTKGIAQGLGIKNTVKSPTFAYVNRYPADDNVVFYHYDLYRLNTGDDTSSIGLDESMDNRHAINVVEWADRLGDDLPEEYVRVDFKTHPENHTISLTFVDDQNFSQEKVQEWYKFWGVPIHVRQHMEKVAEVAQKMAEDYMSVGQIIDLNHLYFAAILHDIARVCDFEILNKDHFDEPITDEKLAKWEALRKECAGRNHEDIASDFLKKEGYPQIAEIIRIHKSTNIVEENALDTLEKKIMYYADKRVMHNKIVPLKERFEDGKMRHGKENDKNTRALYEEVEKQTHALEKELFEPLYTSSFSSS